VSCHGVYSNEWSFNIVANDLNVSFFFPVYKDERTVREVALAGINMLENLAKKYEIIIIDDCSPDNAGKVADELAAEFPDRIRVIHHEHTMGYGAAAKSAIAAAQYEWICMVDGDHEYDVRDLERMLRLRDHYKLMIAFRYKRLYSRYRIFISMVYNMVLRRLFQTSFRDISSGIRCFHRMILEDIELKSNGPFFGAELAIKTMLAGFPVGEFGIQTFPRQFESGSVVTVPNILRTIRDIIQIYRDVFSDQYQLPAGRRRRSQKDWKAPT
jgi:glycosyltransferase involved in cell wall biosynthesis